MQAIRDSVILLTLLLVVVSIRVTPLEDIVDLVPEAQAASAERPTEESGAVPAKLRSSCSGKTDTAPNPEARPLTPPPMGTPKMLEVRGLDGSRVMVLIEVERDRHLEAVIDDCPTDPDPPQEAPAAGAAC